MICMWCLEELGENEAATHQCNFIGSRNSLYEEDSCTSSPSGKSTGNDKQQVIDGKGYNLYYPGVKVQCVTRYDKLAWDITASATTNTAQNNNTDATTNTAQNNNNNNNNTDATTNTAQNNNNNTDEP
ncbi:hypothetical protein Pcinc_038683 [Petrolisthes cinctipes]|uniref:Uncharacterized protein n=1 Tax=Petrolisthes cinctipes TaxID=88211 RepID=A0AAE1BQJ2_PETCI|nr:hypothetical protein Pcinc_038683 [Petrolisthes cinctipes]